MAALSRLHEDIADALGLDHDEVERVCAELESAGYLAWVSPS